MLLEVLASERVFFDTDEQKCDAEDDIFPTPSTWMPPKGRDVALETYIKRVKEDIKQNYKNITRYPEVTSLNQKKRSEPTKKPERPYHQTS